MSYLYRGKRADTFEWVYGWLIIESLRYGTRAIIRVQGDEERPDVDHVVYWPTVGKQLGIKDIKGIEVYEGDIVLVKGNPEITKKEYLNQKYIIEYNSKQFRWSAKPLSDPCNQLFLPFISKDAEIVEIVSVTAAKLKVFYMANITPVQESNQVDLETAIEAMKVLYPSKQNKKK